jgi:hypothetical protein
MKREILFLSALFLTMAGIGFGQKQMAAPSSAVAINSSKVSYERKGKTVTEYKKKFEVNYPKFSNITNPRVKKNLEDTLSYWKNFEMNLEESLGEFTWLDSFDYQVNYNKKSLLDIELIMEGSGAYPSGTVKTLVVNLNTGKRIYINEVFTNLGQLIVKIDQAQKDEIKDHIVKLKKEYPEDFKSVENLFQNKRYTSNKLDEYSINDKGVTFLFDYGFPHAVQALEPDGRYFFTWAEMKPFIKPDGLLGSFVR